MLALALLMTTTTVTAADQTVYIGTRVREGRSEGIYRMKFDPATGALRDVQLAAKTLDPSFIAIHPTRPLVFAVVAAPEGKMKSFAIESGGALRELSAVGSKGAGPAHVQVDRSGKWVTSANFTSGSVSVHRIEADGKLSEAVDWVQHEGKGPHPTRQAGPHAHSTFFSSDNKHIYACDLGLDEVKVYGFNAATGKLTPEPSLMTPKGAGPRHLVIGKKRIYVLNEISSSVSVFENGKLIETVSALPAGFQGESSAAEIVMDTAEKFLYSSNRGADTIAVFRVGDRLTKVVDTMVRKVPRGFVLSPNGKFLLVASQDEDKVQSYAVDGKTGLLTPAGEPITAGFPICLRFASNLR
jgi:6-phosphogluconolactonase